MIPKTKQSSWAIVEEIHACKTPKEVYRLRLDYAVCGVVLFSENYPREDTLHSGQESWTLKQMVEAMDKQAHGDIDELFTLKEVITAKFQETIKQYEDLLAKLKVQFQSKEGKEPTK